jgi:hypothetical protein
MELDELKKMWNEIPLQNQSNTNIMELIQNKSYGPLAALKSTYRKQMWSMTLVPLLIMFVYLDDTGRVFTSILFWSYIAFCIGVVLFARYNYSIVKNLQSMDAVVKTNLEKQITLLEKRATLEVHALRWALLFFMLLLEVVPYFQQYRMLDKWHSLPVLIRIGAYVGLLLLQYVLNKQIKKRKVGRHLTYLKELVNQMH